MVDSPTPQAASPLPVPAPIVVLAIALVLSLLTACAGFSSTSPTPSPTATPTSTATPAPTPELPALRADKGWHVVLTMGNVFGNPVVIGGSFVATKPYKLYFECRGSGTLRITYPGATETAPCRETPELNGTGEKQPPAGSGNVTINVTTEGNVEWEAIAIVKD